MYSVFYVLYLTCRADFYSIELLIERNYDQGALCTHMLNINDVTLGSETLSECNETFENG